LCRIEALNRVCSKSASAGIHLQIDSSHSHNQKLEDLNGEYMFPRKLPAEVEWTDKFTVVRPIVLNEKILGKILIESHLKDLRERTRDAVSLTAAIAAGMLLIVYLLTVVLGRSISEPIQSLAEIARRIAERSERTGASSHAAKRRDVSNIECGRSSEHRATGRRQQSHLLESSMGGGERHFGRSQRRRWMAPGTEDWQDANPEQLIKEADVALGRNRSVLAKPSGLHEIQISSLAEDKVPALISGMTRCSVT
jgi:hypothetical protein